jgi:hypothetical protein
MAYCDLKYNSTHFYSQNYAEVSGQFPASENSVREMPSSNH